MESHYGTLRQKTYWPVYKNLGYGPTNFPEMVSLQNRAEAVWEAHSSLGKNYPENFPTPIALNPTLP